MARRRPGTLLALAFFGGLALSPAVSFSAAPRGPLAERGVPNFEQVDEHVSRGGQPSAAGYAELARRGVRTIVILRRAGSVAPAQRDAERAGLVVVSIPLPSLAAPSVESMRRVLDVIEDPAREPVFVHCRRGADRTGTVVAAYRMERHCWSLERALAEAEARGMAWYEWSMRRFLRAWAARPELKACVAVP